MAFHVRPSDRLPARDAIKLRPALSGALTVDDVSRPSAVACDFWLY